MSSQGPDCEIILKVIQDKFNESFKYFMGNGSLASSMYIDSQLHSVEEQKTKSFDELYNDFLSNDSISRSNLILGDSGVGKTTLGLHTCQKFWKDHDTGQIDLKNDRIPIYIHLPSVVKNLKKNIFFRFLGKNSSLVDSVAKLKLLLVLDGFDELSDRNENIYKINQWGYPPYRDVRVVILSRHEIPQSHKTGLFEFIQESEHPSNSSTYSEYKIQSFNSKDISGYIDLFDHFILSKDENELSGSVWEMTKYEYTHHGWSKADYLKWFDRFRDLKSLAKTPLVLSLVMQTLPKVCRGDPGQGENEKDILKNIEKFCKTKVSVFDGFTECWFYFQFKRLDKARRLTDFRIHWSVFKEFCYVFGQNVAYCMISRERDESRGLLKDSFISQEILNKKFLEVNGNDYTVSQEIKSECIQILKSSENIPELLDAVRIACLIKYSEISLSRSERTFLISFFHRSLAEYFVSRDLFQGLAGEFDFFLSGVNSNKTLNENFNEEENVRGLNSYLLKEEGIILNLADRVKTESDLKNTLFSIIHESRNLSLISIMSANAISILNIGGISLSGHDFSWVQIPGANLNNSICGNTNFNGANLQNVSFENSWLFCAQFKGANLEGTHFGLVPNIPIENSGVVIHIEIRQESESWFLYVGNVCETTGWIKIVKWDLLTLDNVKEYKTSCNTQKIENFGFNFWNEKYLIVWRENLILFDLESGDVLTKLGIPTDPELEAAESEFPVRARILGLEKNGLYVTWSNVLKIFDINLNPGTKGGLQLTLAREYTVYFPLFSHMMKEILNTIPKFKTKIIVDFLINVEFGLVVGYINIVQFVDKDFRMTFNDVMIRAFDINSSKRQIVVAVNFGFMEIWSIESKVRLKKLRPSSGFIKTVVFSQDFKYLISGAIDEYYGNSITIWDNENDWSVLDIIRMGKDIPAMSLRIWFTNDGKTTLVIASPHSIKLHPVDDQDETNNQSLTTLISQKKFISQDIDSFSCSVDGNFLATMSKVSRSQPEKQGQILSHFFELSFKISQGLRIMNSTQLFSGLGAWTWFEPITPKQVSTHAYRMCNPTQLYRIQIYNCLTGNKESEFEFSFEEIDSGVPYMTFVLNNRILCIQTTGGGTTFSLIYDMEGNIVKNRTEIILPHCRFYSTQINRDGTLIGFILRSGQIKLFKLMSLDPYIEEWGCIQNSTVTTSNLKPRFIKLNSSGTLLWTASFEHESDDTPTPNTAQIQIWNIQSDPMVLLTEFSQTPFSLPMSFMSKNGLISFDLTTLSSHQEDFDLFAQVNNQNNNIVKISQIQQQGIKDIFEISFWFKIKILKFIPYNENSNINKSSKLVVSDKINMCCLQICLAEDDNSRRPSWSILWSFCSNLNLVVQELNLNGCISLEESIFHSLKRLGANPEGKVACSSQEYISKCNLICPILGSSNLPCGSMLRCEKYERLSPSNDKWILSVIGKKSGIPFLKGKVKFVSHVFLALEGLKRDRRFITEAHLRESESRTYFVLRPVPDLETFRRENEGSSLNQWYRTRVQGERMLEDILLDYQNHWEYKFLTHNCVSWCKKKLKNNGIVFKSRIWDKLIVAPSAVAVLGRQRVK